MARRIFTYNLVPMDTKEEPKMVFSEIKTAKIVAPLTGTTDTQTIDGVTAGTTTPENAAAQINKILNIVGKSVEPVGMVRILTQEAINND